MLTLNERFRRTAAVLPVSKKAEVVSSASGGSGGGVESCQKVFKISKRVGRILTTSRIGPGPSCSLSRCRFRFLFFHVSRGCIEFGIWRTGGWGRVVSGGVRNLETCREVVEDLTDRAGSKLFIISRDESGRVRCGELKQVAGRVGSDAGNSKISRVGSSHLTRPDPTREN